jgi:tyrosyl-tRNA synthetase
MQAYDSVAMDVDMEIGGADQTFNMLCGRHLMKALKGKEKLVLSIPLLTGTDGQKMSKSLDNYIPLEALPEEMFGKIMSMQDSLINQYIELCTDLPLQPNNVKANPMESKKRLAWEIVKIYHGEEAANKAREEFERVFQKRELPKDHILIHDTSSEEEDLISLLVKTGLAPSKSEAKRLIEQNAVEIDGKLKTKNEKLKTRDGMVLKVGKHRFAKIRAHQ